MRESKCAHQNTITELLHSYLEDVLLEGGVGDHSVVGHVVGISGGGGWQMRRPQVWRSQRRTVHLCCERKKEGEGRRERKI